MARFKCIKPTMGFELGKTYESDDEGHIMSHQRWDKERYASSHMFSEREIRLNSEYFEEIYEPSFTIATDGYILPVAPMDTPKIWNKFPSIEAADMEVLRRESVANRWKPTEGEYYWFFQFGDNKAYASTFDDHTDYTDFCIGNTHETAEEAEEWGKKYAKAFEYLLK